MDVNGWRLAAAAVGVGRRVHHGGGAVGDLFHNVSVIDIIAFS